MNPKGDFVAGWARRRSDGIARGVFGRLYAADGTPRTGEFRLSEHAADRSWTVRLALMDDGSFVATFPAAGGSRAAFRRFAADGKPLGGDVLVTRDPSSFSTVATRGDGSFVVVWKGTFSEIDARAFGTDGEPLGPAVQVAAPSSDRPELAVNTDGSFLVVWNDAERISESQVDSFLLGRLFEADGAPRGDAFLVSDRLANVGIEGFDVAVDWAGQYFVTWTRQKAGVAPDGFLRRYAADGTPLTGILPMDHRPSGDEIARDAGGGFVSVWQSRTLDPDIIVRRYAVNGEPLGSLVRLNQRTAGVQHSPRIAGDGNGSFVAIWQSGVGTKGGGVFARRLLE
jgi:hypothetical protein